MPLMQLKMLVLPAPLGPMIAKKSPAAISRLTPARAATPPKLRCNPSRASSAIRAYAPPRPGQGHIRRSPLVIFPRRRDDHVTSGADATLTGQPLSIGG